MITAGLNSQETSRLEHAEFHIRMPSDHNLMVEALVRSGHSFCVIGRTPRMSNARGVILRLSQNTLGQLDITLCNAGLHPLVMLTPSAWLRQTDALEPREIYSLRRL